MQTNFFPSCCGLEIISKLGHDFSSGHGSQLTSNREIIDYIKESRGRTYHARIQIIILNEGQLKSIGEKIFLDLNFKIVPLGLYKGHNNNLFLLHCNPNEDGDKLK